MSRHLSAEEGERAEGQSESDDGNLGSSFSFSPSLLPSSSSSPQAPPLGKRAVVEPLPRIQAVRAEKHRIRGAVRYLLASEADAQGYKRPSVCACGYSPAGAQVAISKRADGVAIVNGLKRCGAIWLCAECSSRIRAARATEIEEASRRWEGGIELVTLTVAHSSSDSLAVLMEAVSTGWSNVMRRRAWKGKHGTKAKHGIHAMVRALEITYGRNGWHVHIHALMFTWETFTSEEREAFSEDLYWQWRQAVTQLGAGAPSEEHGIDVQNVGADGQVLAHYLTKIEGEVSIGFEMARSDTKRGKKAGRYTPWELAIAGAEGDEQLRARFIEYAACTKGRKLLTWSRGFREELGMAEELSDEQLLDGIEAAEAVASEPVMFIDADDWRALREVVGGFATLLEMVEADRLDAARCLVQAAVLVQGRLFDDNP